MMLFLCVEKEVSSATLPVEHMVASKITGSTFLSPHLITPPRPLNLHAYSPTHQPIKHSHWPLYTS